MGHSGSTILDLSLGSHNQIIGLGEIWDVIRQKDISHHLKSVCSCGKTGYECDFWQKTIPILEQKISNIDKYLQIIDIFFKKYGNNTILIDSSKNSYDYLKILNEKFDLKVIFLTRDYRSWAYSRNLRTHKPFIYFTFRWIAENIKLISELQKMNLQIFNIGYEELALFPEITLRKICDFIGLEFDKKMLNPAETNSHIIAGNIVRTDKEKRSQIIYDARWLVATKPLFWTFFVHPFVNKFNKKLVYSNLLDKNLKPDSFLLFNTKRSEKFKRKYN